MRVIKVNLKCFSCSKRFFFFFFVDSCHAVHKIFTCIRQFIMQVAFSTSTFTATIRQQTHTHTLRHTLAHAAGALSLMLADFKFLCLLQRFAKFAAKVIPSWVGCQCCPFRVPLMRHTLMKKFLLPSHSHA